MIRQLHVWGEEAKRTMDWLIKGLIKVGALAPSSAWV